MARDRVIAIEMALDDFDRGELDVEQLQSKLDAAAATLDNSTPELLQELRSVDAELESIRFTMLLADQRGQALERLAQTRAILRRALDLIS